MWRIARRYQSGESTGKFYFVVLYHDNDGEVSLFPTIKRCGDMARATSVGVTIKNSIRATTWLQKASDRLEDKTAQATKKTPEDSASNKDEDGRRGEIGDMDGGRHAHA